MVMPLECYEQDDRLALQYIFNNTRKNYLKLYYQSLRKELDLSFHICRILLTDPDPDLKKIVDRIKDIDIIGLEIAFEYHNVDVAIQYTPNLVFERFLSDHPDERSYKFIEKYIDISGNYPSLNFTNGYVDEEFLNLCLQNPVITERQLGKHIHILRCRINENKKTLNLKIGSNLYMREIRPIYTGLLRHLKYLRK